ncbi:MAG: ABC transporter substrate-binding protein, partial [Myxococcales bacterium]|nr:ABC transporter substrate-binding protein [Myxococcales bacterium]
MVLGICAGAAGACTPAERPRDHLIVGLEGTPTQVDPRFSLDAYSSRVGTLLYAGLLRTTPDGATEPALAETMEVPSPTHYRLRLREGLRFHDGSPLEAADVAATLESIQDPAVGSPKAASFALLSHIETIDARTLDLYLTEPHAPFPVALTVGIVPRAWRHRAAGTEPPPGAGPYRLARWDRGRALRLERFEGYYEGRPTLGAVEFQVVPDPTVALLKLKAGELDLLQNMVNPDHLKALARMPDLQVIEAEGVNYSYLGFNLEDPVVGNVLVRRALAHAIDRRSIVTHLLRDSATPATGLLAPSNWAYTPDVRVYPYDPARARALLDEAGYPKPPGGGPRLRINYKTSTNPQRRQIAEIFQQQLADGTAVA